MDASQIERINALARKQKVGGLTGEEKEEQRRLRQQYLKEFRENMRQTLDRVYVQQEDGSYQKLQRKFTPGIDPDRPKS